MSRRLLDSSGAGHARKLAAVGVTLGVAPVLAVLGTSADQSSPATAPAGPPAAVPTSDATVRLRLLGVNDLHGHLEPPAPGRGGAAWLAAELDRATLPGRTIRVHAGDMVGTSPLISSHFHDEPTIEVANRLGFEVGALGNHELDEGGDELLRLVRGGRRRGVEALRPSATGQRVNTSSPDFAGAAFPLLSANAFDRGGAALLPATHVVERAGVRVGFIGVTTPTTPRYLLRRHAERLRFTDMSAAVNRSVRALRTRGVRAIVVLAHAGAPQRDEHDPGPATGEIVAEAREMDAEVDVVIAGHSHSLLDLRVPGAGARGDTLVVEADSYGTAYDVVDLDVERGSGQVVAKSARTRPVLHDRSPDGRLAALVGRYARRVAALGERLLARAPAPVTRHAGDLTRLAADAQRALASSDLALVDPRSLRADLPAGPISYADVAAAQAYDHPVLRFELRGRELEPLLEGRSSSGLVVSGWNGAGLVPENSYSVAVSEWLATTGRLALLRDRASRAARVGTEVEALAGWLEQRW